MIPRRILRLFTAQTVLVIILAIYSIGFSTKAFVNQKTVYGDGRYYYSWVRSAVVDHDINFHNEYEFYGIHEPNAKPGFPRNVYPVGPALFWSQPFIWSNSIFRNDGYSFPYQFAVGATGVLSVIAGLVVLYRVLNRFFDTTVSLFTIIALSFATNLFFYGSLDTVNSHGISFFISTIILSLFLTQKRPFILGLFIGILSLIRSQDAIFLFLLLPAFSAISIARGFGGFLLGFSPQLVAWQLLTGTMTKSPYLDQEHTFSLGKAQLLNVLFSPNNGLFFWTPILFFATIGLFFQLPITKTQRVTFLLLIGLQWYIVASWSFWWQGASYSGRMFISLLPVFAFGLGSFLTRLTNTQRMLLVGFFSLLNIVTMALYLTMH